MTARAHRHPPQRPRRRVRRLVLGCALALLLAQVAGCGRPARPDLPTDYSLRMQHEANVARVLNPPTYPEDDFPSADYEHILGLVLTPPSLQTYDAERRRRQREDWQQLDALQREAIQREIALRERRRLEFLEFQRRTREQYEELSPGGSGWNRRALQQWLDIQKRLAYEEAARKRYQQLFDDLQNRAQSEQDQ